MVRQAHTYLVGAVSGATLIAIAIAAFVLLISAQVFGEWPIAGFGESEETAVHESKPVGGAPAEPAPAAAAVTTTATAGANAKAGGADDAGATDPAGEFRGGATTDSQAAEDVVAGGNPGDSGTSPSNPGTGGSGGGGATSPGGGGGGGSGGSGGSSGGGSSTASSPSQTVTETVNNTVTKVDQTVTGGALEATGVTGVTEEVVKGVVGPESVVGKTVDGVTGTVGGLLTPKP